MVCGHGVFAQHDVTLDALKIGLCALLLDLVIQDAIYIRFNMTTATPATGLNGYERLFLKQIHCCGVVARSTTQFIVNIKLMSIASGTSA